MPELREKEIKNKHYKKISGKLRDIANDVFGVDCIYKRGSQPLNHSGIGESIIVAYGALEHMVVEVKDENTLLVGTTPKLKYTEEEAIDTQAKYNEFMFKATGYNAKQRSKIWQKMAKEGRL